MTSARRVQVLEQVAALIPGPSGEDCVRVGIDGVDGSGKTTFADELATVLRDLGRPVVRISVDDFHHVRSIRYRRGRRSPDGFYLDSFNYARLRADVLDPLGPGGSRRYRPAAHDLITDEILRPTHEQAPPGATLITDGLFLHRNEIRDAWDFSIYLDVPFEVTAARMSARDGTSPDPTHPTLQRYVAAQNLYFQACDPRTRATLVIDNSNLDHPRVVHTP